LGSHWQWGFHGIGFCDDIPVVTVDKGDAGYSRSMLFRVKFANDATNYMKLAQTREWKVKKGAALAHWPIEINDAMVAKASLKPRLNDLCPACVGKGVQKKPFEETLSEDPCEVCEGTGS
jgi:DnaJ-class molecular chaperone